MILYDTFVVCEWPSFGTVMFSDCRVPTQSLLPPPTPSESKAAGTEPLWSSCSNISLPDMYTYLNYLYVWWYIVVEFVPVAVALWSDKNGRRFYEHC